MIKNISKRKKLIIATGILILGLFVAFYLTPIPRIVLIVVLSILADIFLFIALYEDIKQTPWQGRIGLFILPLFATLAFGLFYFLLPARFLTRFLVSILFGVTIYALYLSHNIYAVAGIRTIQLLNAARSVGFLLSVLIHFFLTNIIFSLHLIFPLAFALVFLLSFFLSYPVMWSVNLDTRIQKTTMTLTMILALVISELSIALAFWPASPTVAALFISGNFYTFVGLAQAWLERRLFKNTFWEYVGVAIIVFLVLITRTKWGS